MQRHPWPSSQHVSHRALHAEELRPVRRAPGLLPRQRVARPHPPLHPGVGVSPIRSEMFSDGYGFVVDYLAEVLRSKRSEDFSDRYKTYFTLDSTISTRDQDGIRKNLSGLMKLIHPNGDATEDEVRDLLEYAIEGRKRVKDQILRIDATMRDNTVRFRYSDQLERA